MWCDDDVTHIHTAHTHKFLIFSGWSREKVFKGCWFHRLPATLRGCCWFWQLLSESSHTGVLQPKKCAQSVNVTDIYVRAAAFFGAHTFFFKTLIRCTYYWRHIKSTAWQKSWAIEGANVGPGAIEAAQTCPITQKSPTICDALLRKKTPLVCIQICKNQTDFFRSRKV